MNRRRLHIHSLRTRILITLTGLIIIGFAALTAFAGQQLSAGTTTDFKERMIEQAQLIARGLKDSVEHLAEGEGNPAAMEEALKGYGNQFGIEVTLLQANGRSSSQFSRNGRFRGRSRQLVIERDWRPGFTIDLQQKDLRLVLEAADQFGVPTLGTSTVFQLYRTLQQQGLGGDGNHALVKALENLAGFEINPDS